MDSAAPDVDDQAAKVPPPPAHSPDGIDASGTSLTQCEAVPAAASRPASRGRVDSGDGDTTQVIIPQDQDELEDEGRGVEENGRIYPSFGKFEYGMPIDDKELDRNDLQHQKFTLLIEDKLYVAPVPDSVLEEPGSRVLDLGTGSGIWAIDMADKFPDCEVVGTDIAAVQPSMVPPNCIFEIEDVEDDWPYPREYFDFIHGRDLLTAIRNWPHLMSQAFNATRPGGWIQLASTIPEILSDDNTLPPNCAFRECGDHFFTMAEAMGAPLDAPRGWRAQLIEAGYVNVQDVIIKLPSGPWAKDPRLRMVGLLERAMLIDNLEAYMLRGWTQILGRAPEELAVLVALAKRELNDPKMHSYVFFHITYGQKPQVM